MNRWVYFNAVEFEWCDDPTESQIAWQIATWAMEIHGGSGFMKEIGLEKRVRDAAAFLHSDGVNRTLFLKAANYLYKG